MFSLVTIILGLLLIAIIIGMIAVVLINRRR